MKPRRALKLLPEIYWPAIHPLEYAVMILVIGFGAYLRFDGLSVWTPAADDALHMIFANRSSLWDAITYTLKYEMHPPLSYIMLYLLINYVSTELEVLRLIGIIPGLLLMPVMYIFGRVLMGRAAGIFLMAVTAFSHVCIIQSENMRSYSLCQMLLAGGILAAYYYLQQKQRKWLVLYYTFMALALFTEYVSALAVAAMGGTMLYFLWEQGRRKITREMLLLGLGHFLLALFWAAQITVYLHGKAELADTLRYIREGLIHDANSFFDALSRVFSGFLLRPGNPLYDPLFAVSLLGIGVLIRHRKWVFVIPIFIALSGGVAASVAQLYPLMDTRHSMWIMLFTFLPLAYLAQQLWDVFGKHVAVRAVLVATLAALVMSNGFFLTERFFDPDYYRDFVSKENRLDPELEMHAADYESALRFLEENMREGDWLASAVSDNLRLYYYTFVGKKFTITHNEKKITCTVWVIRGVSQFSQCINDPYSVYKDENPIHKKFKEIIQKRIRDSKDIFILTSKINLESGQAHPRAPDKPFYTSPTVEVFVLTPQDRQKMVTFNDRKISKKQSDILSSSP